MYGRLSELRVVNLLKPYEVLRPASNYADVRNGVRYFDRLENLPPELGTGDGSAIALRKAECSCKIVRSF